MTSLPSVLDPQADAIWILSSTFIVFTMQSGKSFLKVLRFNAWIFMYFRKINYNCKKFTKNLLKFPKVELSTNIVFSLV